LTRNLVIYGEGLERQRDDVRKGVWIIVTEGKRFLWNHRTSMLRVKKPRMDSKLIVCCVLTRVQVYVGEGKIKKKYV